MLFANPIADPVAGRLMAPSKKFYPGHPLAVRRAGTSRPLVTQDFGPSGVDKEPAIDWRGGEFDIFGKRIAAKFYPHFHRGIDISTGGCTGDVRAAAPGTVRVSKFIGNAGLIVIAHGMVGGHQYATVYGHLSELRVHVGDPPVAAGKVIGTLGGGGVSTGCHLHFAVKKDGRWVDPWRRLRQHTTVDPDGPAPIEPVPVQPIPIEEVDMPIPASDAEYVAGHRAVIGNATVGAHIRTDAEVDAEVIRTVPGGQTEEWLPTCWVVGETAFNSDRWLTRWHDGQWEFTHKVNVASVTPL